MMYHLQKLLSSEWRHGAVLVTVCTRANIRERREDYHPRYLLGEVRTPYTYLLGEISTMYTYLLGEVRTAYTYLLGNVRTVEA